ncbi:MAG: nucleotidyltransferase domain-containing protein [Betaproteobacteria bacterium]|nr:nucleotidyltransferase domain-containing protein [Betaproteobacteria bacterium]
MRVMSTVRRVVAGHSDGTIAQCDGMGAGQCRRGDWARWRGDAVVEGTVMDELAAVRAVLAGYPDVELAFVYGSVAKGTAQAHSDLDVAVQATQVMDARRMLALMDDLAAATERPVDLVDLRRVGEPLLGEILRHGAGVVGTAAGVAELAAQHVANVEDFVPLQQRLLRERARRWTGK